MDNNLKPCHFRDQSSHQLKAPFSPMTPIQMNKIIIRLVIQLNSQVRGKNSTE